MCRQHKNLRIGGVDIRYTNRKEWVIIKIQEVEERRNA